MSRLEDRERELEISRQLRELPDPLTKPYLCTPADPCGHCDLCDPTRPFTDTPANGQHEEEPEWGEDDPIFIDWPRFWAREHHDEEWLFEPVLALGRGHALYAGHKQGKSLFTIWMCAQIAARGDTDIVYLDYEMTENDLYERLEDMGHGPDTDFSRFHYALLPSLPPLDTAEGATALLELCDTVQHGDRHLAVIVDTTSRAVEGDENSADTFREFYRWTGITLKRRGITWARLDHAGKDALKGQRGSSGKGDDVDVIWRLTQADQGGIALHRDAARMAWIPETVRYAQTHGPLGYTAGAELWPPGTKELADELDGLDLPLDATYKQARDAGIQARKAVVLKALKFRRREVGTAPGTTLIGNLGNQPGNQPAETPLTSGNPNGNRWEPEAAGEWEPGSPPKGEPVPPVPNPEPYELAHYCTRCDRPATDISGLCPGCQANPGTLPPLNRNELF